MGEVKGHRRTFDTYDPGGTGEIASNHLAKLLAQLFPDAARNVKAHRKCKELLDEADKDGDGKIDFSEYLKLMRLFQYHSQAERLAKEKDIVAKTGFTRAEVK